jgi:hypothetical protein
MAVAGVCACLVCNEAMVAIDPDQPRIFLTRSATPIRTRRGAHTHAQARGHVRLAGGPPPEYLHLRLC